MIEGQPLVTHFKVGISGCDNGVVQKQHKQISSDIKCTQWLNYLLIMVEKNDKYDFNTISTWFADFVTSSDH